MTNCLKQIDRDKVKDILTLKTNIYNAKIYCWVVVKTDRLCTLNSVVLGKLPIGAVEMTNKTNYQTERRTDRKTGRKLKILNNNEDISYAKFYCWVKAKIEEKLTTYCRLPDWVVWTLELKERTQNSSNSKFFLQSEAETHFSMYLFSCIKQLVFIMK